MLYTRNAYHFRKYYKEEVAKEKGRLNLNFVGSLHPDKSRDETGFSKLIYGNRVDLGKLLGTIALNVAADDQAIYELIQNADDCKSSFFSVSYNEKYLLCINNGNYFSDDDMSAIINVAGSNKDGEDIGTFGIGFKILHRLVGTNDGREAIINDYAGPIIFSWNEYYQLKKIIAGEPIFVSGIGKAKENYNYERDKENPWLVKLLYTCFPSNYKEPIRLGDYDTRDVKFDEKELVEMRKFLSGSLQNVNLSEDNYLKNGAIFFLRLGKGKSKFLDEGIDKIKSGLSYSFKFLNSLKKIYINGDEIKEKLVLDYSHSFPIGSKKFIEINPLRNKTKQRNKEVKHFKFSLREDDSTNDIVKEELEEFDSDNDNTFFSISPSNKPIKKKKSNLDTSFKDSSHKDNLKYTTFKYLYGEEVAIEMLNSSTFGTGKLPFEKLDSGEESILFKQLKDSMGVTAAVDKMVELHTSEFIKKHGNWLKGEYKGELNIQGEPSFESLVNIETKGTPDKESSERAELRRKSKEDSVITIGNMTGENVNDTVNFLTAKAHFLLERGTIDKNLLYKELFELMEAKEHQFDSIARDRNNDKSKRKKASAFKEKISESIKEENRDKLIALVERQLSSLGYEEIGKEKTTDYRDKMAENPDMKEIWDSDKKWQLKEMDTVSFNLKLFLAGIKKQAPMESPNTRKYELNSMGLHTYIPAEDMLLKLLNFFDGKKLDADYMLDKLRNTGIPEFQEVYERLTAKKKGGETRYRDAQRIINGMVTSLNRIKNSKNTIVFDNGDFKVYSTNTELNSKYLVQEWKNNQRSMAMKGEVYRFDKLNNPEMTKEAIKDFEKLRFRIGIVLNSSNTKVALAGQLKDDLLKVLNSKEGKGRKGIKALESFLDSNYNPDLVDTWTDFAMVESALHKIADYKKGKGFILKEKEVSKVKEAIENLITVKDINDDNIAVNRIEMAIPLVKEYLDKFGMIFKESTIRKFLSRPGDYVNKDLINPKEVLAANLAHPGNKYKTVAPLYTILGNALEGKGRNPLDSGAVETFKRLKVLEETEGIKSTFINDEGKQEASYGFTSAVGDAIKEFKAGYRTQMYRDPFSKHSLLIDKGSSRRNFTALRKDYDLVFIGALKNTKAGKVVNKTSMSDREMLAAKLALFSYNNTGFKKKYAIYEPFVPSDKSRRFAIKSERFELSEDTRILTEYEKSENMHIESPVQNIELGDKEFNNLFNIIEAEASRINHIAQLTPEQRATFSNKYLKGGSKFLILPRLNEARLIKEHTDRNGIIDIEGLRENRLSKRYLEEVLREEVNNLYNNMRDAKVINERGVINYINKEYKESLKGDSVYRENKETGDYDNLSKVEDFTNQTLNFAKATQALTEMAYNDMIQGFNFYTLMGDPAHYYKEGANDHISSRTTAANNFKRFGSMVGAKMVGNFKFPTNYGGEMRNVNHSKIKYLILKDRITDRYSEHYKETGINKDFGSSNSADAQVYTTLRGHIINLYALGKIDDNIFNSIHSKIVKNYKSGKPINLTEEEKIALVPQKPLYTGEYMNGDVMVPFIEKSSTIPLTESMLRDTELDKLRLHMEELEKESMFDENGNLKDFDTGVTVRTAYESSIKVGGVEGVQIYNEDGTINVNKFKDFKDLVVDSRNLGIQQEESLHTENKINIVSQMDKLLHSGTLDLEGFTFKGQKKTGEELRKIKDDIKTEWITKKFEELEKKYKIEDGRYSNSSKLVKHVLKVAEENGVGFADLDLMKLENGGFKYPLFANRSYKKVLAAMLSEISRGVLRPKISGLGSVQVSNAGMLFKWGTKNSDIIFTEDFNESLKYTRYEDGNLKSAQVLVSREYFENKGVDVELLTKELEDGRKVIDTDKVDAELLKSIGAKLPNRNHSSMLRIEIAGFLPKEFKNIVIVPDEITKQMNSDFDIDHLYKYLYNYRVRRRTNSKPISAERKTQFDSEYEKFINERRWDKSINKTRKLKNFDNFDAHKAKMSIANKLGMWYEVEEGKKNGNLYDIKKDIVLEKIDSSNTNFRNYAVLENEYIDIHHSVLEHPEVVKLSTRALDFKDTEEIAKEMESFTSNKEESKFFTILSNRFLRDEYESNQAGKDGISIQSSVSMLYSLIGKEKWRMNLGKNDKRFKFNLGGEDVTFEHIGIGEYEYKGEKRTNADNNAMMQNESVDNANNKRLKSLGYSTVSAPAFNGFQFLVSDSGKSLPLKTVSMMMNLPLVKNTYRKLKRETDTFSGKTNMDTHNKILGKVKSSEIDTKLFLDADTLEKALKGELSKEDMSRVE